MDRTAIENLTALAAAKGVPINEINVCILDRPRHAKLIEEVRTTGAAIRLIGDGDVQGIIHTTDPDETGIDIYMASGGVPPQKAFLLLPHCAASAAKCRVVW